MSQTLELLQREFTPERNNQLVNCLHHAYQASIESFTPEHGHDGMVFGLMVYKSAIHFLSQVSNRESWIQMISENPRFLMKVGRYTTGVYKVGTSRMDDPESSFPNNRVGAFMLAEANVRQMSLFGEESLFEDDTIFTNLILCHIGNSEEGLLSVFIGIPAQFNEEREVTAWSTTYSIWNKDKDESPNVSITPFINEPKVDVERIEPPILTLKDKRKQEEN